MSIILEGIDLPKEGEWLEVIIKPSREVIVDTIRYRDNALLKTEYGLVIQIPKDHGRLIDADETRKQYYQTMDELLQSTTIDISVEALSLLCGLTLINNAPTILKAEE